MKYIIIILVSIFTLSACTIENPLNIEGANHNQNTNFSSNINALDNNEEDKENVVFCTQDAKECPDGSFVGRIAPDCAFAPCPDVKDDKIYQPIAEFEERISKKPFGIYITPKDSPVQPEKFTGYHTGVDVEYDDKADEEISVVAIANGEVLRSGWVSGYGGMLAIKHKINNENYIVIYGHLSPSNLPKVGTVISAGQPIAILGKAYSQETDGERKHLHLSVYTGSDVNVRGYTNNQTELSKWIDPLEIIP